MATAGVAVTQGKCVPASTNAACTAISAPSNQGLCDPQSRGTCAGGGGTECTSIDEGLEATCVAVMDDTTGDATPCAWTSTNVCTYSAATGTLKTTLGVATTSIVISAASGVTFSSSVAVVIGTGAGAMTVLPANINTATNSVSNSGTLKTQLSGASTSIVIDTGTGVTFVTTADLKIGSTTVASANVNVASNTLGKSDSVVIQAAAGVAFITTADLKIGTTTVLAGNVNTVTGVEIAYPTTNPVWASLDACNKRATNEKECAYWSGSECTKPVAFANALVSKSK